MDFLDPKKRKAHAIRIWVGYVLIGTALLLATTILLYQAYGFRITREGQVIQNGLVFMSSQPNNAAIYANGERLNRTTNARLSLPAGQYTFEVMREGYHHWKRGITVEGGSVQRFAYPLLIPVDLRTTSLQQYAEPGLMSQSANKRWLLVQSATETFEVFDLNQNQPAPAPVTVPLEALSTGGETTGWEEVEWAEDNRRILLKRLFERGGQSESEYILLDRAQPAESLNLTVLLGFNPSELSLRDGDYDTYYAFDRDSGIVFTASIDEPTPVPHLRNVLDFQDDGRNAIVYVTSEEASEERALIRLYDGEESYTLREVPRDDRYLLNIARYSNSWIVAAGAQSEGRVYVYEDPFDDLRAERVVVPVQILRVERPSQVAFSSNARFVMINRGENFAVYDAETNRGYAYRADLAEGGNVGAVGWMDGHRLTVVSDGELSLFDFDGTNQHTLVPARSGYLPAVDPDSTALYVFSPDNELTRTSLLTPEDE